jgi:hypothetical protein
MSINYVKKLPRDMTGEAMQQYPPAVKANARYTSENAIASSVISLSHDTTSIEITTVGVPAVMRWVPVTETAAVAPAGSVIGVAGTTANYDHAIAANTTRKFAVPIETVGLNVIGSVVGINRQAGLYQRVAVKAQAIGSVLTAEY